MGMDVYGEEPRSEKGEYFRTTEAYWHPLADYVCVVAPSISSKCRYWHSNDGDGLNDEDSRSLAIVLREELSSGRTADYAQAFRKQQADLPMMECSLCRGTGTRNDEIGQRRREAEPTYGCNGCGGTGEMYDPQTWSRFQAGNVSRFAEFLEDCGGFEIC